jgi:hypothetical protein
LLAGSAECRVRRPHGIVIVSVIASGYLVTRLRLRAAAITAFVGAVGALTWIALGGFADFSCDLGI